MKKRTVTKEDMPRAIAWFAAELDAMKPGKKYDVEIKQHREKRSLDANAYCWELIDKLAEKLGNTIKTDGDSVKETIYKNAIRDIGGVSDSYCMIDEAVDRFVSEWTAKGIGYQCTIDKSTLPGCSVVTAYRGSSSYTKSEMSRLISYLVEDCRALNIETRPPWEMEGLIEQWR
jgi:hypothetical protein